MQKVVHPCKTSDGKVFCVIKIDGGCLGITGVIGPNRHGKCRGGCGQIDSTIKDAIASDEAFAVHPLWTKEMLAEFLEIWDRWHLNALRAGTVKQMDYLRSLTFPGGNYHKWALQVLEDARLNPDPVDGYRYGSASLKEEVPESVIAFLEQLPSSPTTPAWV